MERSPSMNGTRTLWVIVFLPLLVAAPATRAQEAAVARKDPGILLRVEGDAPRALELTATDLARLPRQTVRAKDHDGKESAFEGVPLVEILEAAGVKFGSDLRGPLLATYLLVEAADGDRVVFALPELDPACTDRVVLLADRRNGAPLDGKEGPLRIVVPGEKRHSRWVRQVIILKLKRA
jgi:DMSO/TMAO reductase YedYZ molybdopterin-dependent catalytic subunit